MSKPSHGAGEYRTAGERQGTEALLARVRTALGVRGDPGAREDAAASPPPSLDEGTVRRVGPGEDLAGCFVRQAGDLGMRVSRTNDDALAEHVTQILREIGARRACAGLAPGARAQAIESAARAVGCELVAWRDTPGLEAHYDVDCGITDVVAAVAETGSLVVGTDASHSRAGHLVPPCHVAIVPRKAIVADLIDLWDRWSGGNAVLPASISLVSGPSKTADIEGILITGVHGPGVVYVLVVDEKE